MKFSLERSSNINDRTAHEINEIAAAGFGHNDPAEMLDDTLRHIKDADIIQRAIDGKETVGFALYQRCLWRTCH